MTASNANPNVTLRAYRGPEDHPAIIGIVNAISAFNGDPDQGTVADLDNYYGHLDHADLPRDCAIVEIDGDPVAYARTSWEELTGGDRRIVSFVFVNPDVRGIGVEERLVDHALRRAETLIPEIGGGAAVTVIMSAAGRDTELIDLVEGLGLERARRFAALVRPDLDDIPDIPMPQPLDVRPIAPDDRAMHRRVFDANKRALSDSYGQTASSDERWAAFIGFPRLNPGLWRVAFDGDAIAGQILNYLGEPDDDGSVIGFTEWITVQAEYRRRGLARALLAESLRAVRDAGASSASLSVDTQNPNQALTLYESLGFRIVSESFAYQLGPFPAGSRPSLPEVPLR